MEPSDGSPGSLWGLIGWISAHPESLLGSAVLVWVLSQIAGSITVRAQQRRRLRHAAVALRTEIELIRENLEKFIPGYEELADRMRADPARRFFILANRRSQQTLDSLRPDLVTMPGDVLKAVITFYTLDAEINQFLDTLMQPAFVDRPVEQRIEILEVYGDLFDAAVARARDAEAELRLLAWASSPWWSGDRRRFRRAMATRGEPADRALRDRRPIGGLMGPDMTSLPGTTRCPNMGSAPPSVKQRSPRHVSAEMATLHQLVAFAARASRRCTTARRSVDASSSRNSSSNTSSKAVPSARRLSSTAPVRSAQGIVAIEQAVPARLGRSCGKQMMDEQRAGMSCDVPVRQIEIDRMLRLQRKPIERDPRRAPVNLQLELVAGLGQAERLELGRLGDPHRERQGCRRCGPAKADIGQDRPLRQLDPQQHVGPRRNSPFRLAPDDAGGERRDLKAEGAQDVLEQRVVLETVATPAAVDELALQRFRIEPDRPAEQHVEVLEWDPAGMVGLESRQRGLRGLGRAAVADSAEIGIEVYRRTIHALFDLVSTRVTVAQSTLYP